MAMTMSAETLGSVDEFALPTMRCSFPARLHPEYERVREACEPWILKLAAGPAGDGSSSSSRDDEARAQRVRDCLLPRYVCRLFPDAPDVARLQAATKFIAWLTFADDVLDVASGPIDDMMDDHQHMIADSDGGHRDQVANGNLLLLAPRASSWARCVLSTLAVGNTNAQTTTPSSASGGQQQRHDLGGRASILLDALEEVWGEVSAQMAPRARARFVAAMEQHLAAVQRQQHIMSSCNNVGHRLHAAAPAAAAAEEEEEDGGSGGEYEEMGVAEYMAIRRPSSGFLVGFELLLYVLGLEEDPVHKHALLHELRDLSLDYMCMCNDLVSWRMECAAGDFFNLPCVVYGCGMAPTLADAAQHVAHLMHRIDARAAHLLCLHASHQYSPDLIAPLVDVSTDPCLRTYVHTLASCMSGTLRWSFETIRYGLHTHSTAHLDTHHS
jgi:hypothetical protein